MTSDVAYADQLSNTQSAFAAVPSTDTYPALGSPRQVLPFIVQSHGKKDLKGEDVLLSPPKENPSSELALFMVCDGHAGVDCARFVTSKFYTHLAQRLPARLPNFDVENEVTRFAAAVRSALVDTFTTVDNEWARCGALSGSTVTLALITGWLMTVANVGDSTALFDDGHKVVEITHSHRLEDNLEEQRRIQAAGGHLARLGYTLQGPAKPGEHGLGPLRLWPGGLCVARSMGDLDAGVMVVPIPHIKQVLLPKRGGRIIMASDGLWDVFTIHKVARIARSKLPAQAIPAIISSAQNERRLSDDLSLLVIDVLPDSTKKFPTLCLEVQADNKERHRKKQSLFTCLCSPSIDETITDLEGMIFDGDCLKHHPSLQRGLARASAQLHVQPGQEPARHDYTVHGPANGAWKHDLAKSHSYMDVGKASTEYDNKLPAVQSCASALDLNGLDISGSRLADDVLIAHPSLDHGLLHKA